MRDLLLTLLRRLGIGERRWIADPDLRREHQAVLRRRLRIGS
jgi:hypothetical protein